jgi:hypothetical protein
VLRSRPRSRGPHRRLTVLDRLVAIEAQVAAIAAAISVTAAIPEAEPEVAAPAAPEPTETGAAPSGPVWRDEVTYTLAPTEGIEVKLVMQEGVVSRGWWKLEGGVISG